MFRREILQLTIIELLADLESGFSVSEEFSKGHARIWSIAANVGDVAILDFEACFPDSMVGLVPNHHTDLDYLYYLMSDEGEPSSLGSSDPST